MRTSQTHGHVTYHLNRFCICIEELNNKFKQMHENSIPQLDFMFLTLIFGDNILFSSLVNVVLEKAYSQLLQKVPSLWHKQTLVYIDENFEIIFLVFY